jgi:hypothetical protein
MVTLSAMLKVVITLSCGTTIVFVIARFSLEILILPIFESLKISNGNHLLTNTMKEPYQKSLTCL